MLIGKPFDYYVLVLKDSYLVSWDFTIQIVKIYNDYFGLKLGSCKFNQVIESSIFLQFLTEFCAELNREPTPNEDAVEKSASGQYFKPQIDFYYYYQVVRNSDVENIETDDMLEVAFIKGFFCICFIQISSNDYNKIIFLELGFIDVVDNCIHLLSNDNENGLKFSHDCFNDHFETPNKQGRQPESLVGKEIVLDGVENFKQRKVKRIVIDDDDEDASHNTVINKKVIPCIYNH